MVVRRFLLLALVALYSAASVSAQTPSMAGSGRGSPPARIATVTVNTSGSGITIPSDFVGISIETGTVISGGYFQGSGDASVNLIKLLGSNGVIRLGGLTQDTATPPVLTNTIATNICAFLTALGSGWTLIYGLDAVANSPSTAATHAGLIATACGTSKVTFQFGNEPIDGTNFTVSTYQTMWNSYNTSVTAAVPGAKLAAWDDGNFGTTQSAISGLTGGLSGLTYVTQHWYSSPCGVLQSASYLISSVNSNTGAGTNLFANNIWAGSIPQRLSESNSVCGGTSTPSGTTDRLMAATWYLNEAIAFANAGWEGINTHEVLNSGSGVIGPGPNGNGYYNPLWLNADGSFQAGAIFYGMYLFSQIEGQQILPSSVGGNTNVKAIATLRTAGKSNILIVNNDTFNSATVAPAQSAAWTTANVLQMKGAAGCSEASPTVGGQSIGKGGAWTGSATSINNGATVTLGPCEAALISIQ